MVDILVTCPYCGERHLMNGYEKENLCSGGKSVICCSNCDKLYTVEQDTDSIFVSGNK